MKGSTKYTKDYNQNRQNDKWPQRNKMPWKKYATRMRATLENYYFVYESADTYDYPHSKV